MYGTLLFSGPSCPFFSHESLGHYPKSGESGAGGWQPPQQHGRHKIDKEAKSVADQFRLHMKCHPSTSVQNNHAE